MNSLSTSSTSSDAPIPLPSAWVERLFDVMLSTFGKKFVDQWANADPEKLKAHWGLKLAGYSAAEIKRGVDALDALGWPPMLPEFLKLCRPPVDATAAYYEAVQGIAARERGEKGEWSHPAIFWASVAVGTFDLKTQGYAQIRNRWETALEAEMRKGKQVDIPEAVLSLPAPSKREIDRVAAAKVVSDLKCMSGNRENISRLWASKILKRVATGGAVPVVAVRMAKEVLEMQEDAA